MIFKRPFSVFIIIAGLLLITSTALLFGGCSKSKEGFDMVPISRDPSNNIVNGYYQVDDENMAIIPYGFAVDPNDPRKIIPKTKVAYSLLQPKKVPPAPKKGEKLMYGFYFSNEPYLADSSLAALPPNMSPNVEKIEFDKELNPTLLIYYGKGYVSDTQYYKNKYSPNIFPRVLPEGVYYTDASKAYVSFLRYGQVADVSNGYGFILDSLSNALMDYAKSNNRKDINNSYNAEFHDSEELIKERNTLNYGEVRVKDQNGNIIILPRAETQNSTTVYQPGEFPFGSSAYVPNYEDSVYLSSIGYRSILGNVRTTPCAGIYQALNEFKTKIDLQCDKTPK